MHLFLRAKNGEPTVRFRGTLLHSSYNPGREGRRFVEGTPDALCYLILGDGLGHLAAALREAKPDSRILTVHPSRELALSAEGAPGAHVSPESRPELAREMARAFGAERQYGFELLLWEPAATAAPDWFETQKEWVRSIAREWHDSLLSTGYFGLSWLRNACKNLRHLSGSSASPLPVEKQPVLVAAGPTLDRGIEWLRRYRESLFLVAVSSAVPPLARRGIAPDLIVHTDGGHWATHHLRPLTSEGSGSYPPVAAPMRAAFPRGALTSFTLLLVDPASAVESSLLPAAPLPRLAIPGHGTVAGTALRLLSLLSRNPPLLVGLDLAVEGVRSHCRGHAFETIFHAMNDRRRTLPTILQERLGDGAILSAPWRQPRDLGVYAASLSAELGTKGKRCFRLNPSPVALPCEEVTNAWPPPGPSASGASPSATGDGSDPSLFLDPPRRPAELREILLSWRDAARDVSSESLLSPSREPEGFLEELCQLLALPELLRLRKASREGGDADNALGELRSRVVSRIEELMRRSAS